MRYFNYDIVLPDVPGEVSLAFSIPGCNLNCKGCFWKEIESAAPTYELTDIKFQKIVGEYLQYVSCILFYGGEWHPEQLVSKLKIAQNMGLKTCLFTGLTKVSDQIQQHLTYLKTGAYHKSLGGLTSRTTNQRLVVVATGEDLTPQFWRLLPQ